MLCPKELFRNFFSSSVPWLSGSSYFSNNSKTLLATCLDLTKSLIFWPPPSTCFIPRRLDMSTPEPNCSSIVSFSSVLNEYGKPFKNNPRVFTSIKSNVFSINKSMKSSKETPANKHSIAFPAILDMPHKPIKGITSTNSNSDLP